MNSFESIGKFIAQKREERGLTQIALAEELNVSKSTISLYEAGSRKPTLERLTQIAVILKVPVAKFLEFDIPNVANLDVALRAEGISNEDVSRIKLFVKAIKDEQKSKQDKGKK